MPNFIKNICLVGFTAVGFAGCGQLNDSSVVSATPDADQSQTATPKNVPETIDSFFWPRGAPKGLASFKVIEGVEKVSTLYQKSKNEKLNGQIKSHTLQTSMDIKGKVLNTHFRMRNFYGYDAQQNMIESLAIIRSECDGEIDKNGLIKMTRENGKTASKVCKKGLSTMTGKRPLYISKKANKTPFYITCTQSECKIHIVKWNFIGFDVLIKEEHLNEANLIANISYKHIDKMLAPISN